ncbi:unnamed protein product [Adineta ricciae]|uniref:Uncharacterized protein n=1 Tax=Adineta ricciae TaxID=249248 RepID=A0A816D1X4_ADIRI|nr:unnamed protein product [Adineta ricciae]CAF1628974.1 unnamed protein product [Adineta ricciae]
MHRVFYMGHLVPHADPFFFKIIDFDYAKDNHCVYLHGQFLPTANAVSFAPSSRIYPPVMTPAYVHPTISPSNHMIPPMHPSNHSITPIHHPYHMTTTPTHQPNQSVVGGYLRSNDSVHSCILI